MSAVKILILSQYWYPENGVPQRRWSWLSKLLVQAGHEVTVITPPPHYERSDSFSSWLKNKDRTSAQRSTGPSGERILRSGYLPAGRSLTSRVLNQGAVALGMVAEATRKRGMLRGYRPDLVIGTVPAIPTAIITPVVAALFRSSYVIDLRDAWPDLLVEGKRWNEGTGEKSVRERLLGYGPLQVVSSIVESTMYRAFRSAVGIVVTSQELEKHLVNRTQFKGKRPVTATIRNVFPPKTEYEAGDKGQRPTGTLNVLYAGTFGRAQKLSNALEAVRLASQRGVDIHLRLVGSGAALPELRRVIEAQDIPAQIYSRLPAEELYSHYDWADTALVHLTDWDALERAIPSKTYELMASRIHITGVVAGEAAQLIRDLEGGDVVQPENPDALARLWEELSTDRSRLKISTTGQDWVEQQRDSATPNELFSFLGRIKHSL